LHEGIAVELVVGTGLRDAAGRRLVADRRRRYEVGADLREPVSPRAWTIDRPAVGDIGPVVVGFDHPLDRALLEDCLTVLDSSGTPVHGTIHIAAGETQWSFAPDRPWAQGPHHLVVDPVLEDLAGNSVLRVFDRDLDRPDHQPRAIDAVSLPFVPTPPPT
jgi:hypothetical protein